jgi:hypothetical protein
MMIRRWAGVTAALALLLTASGCSVPEQSFEFEYVHVSAYDKTLPITPSAVIVEGKRQEVRFPRLAARFPLVRAEDGTYHGTGELTYELPKWEVTEWKTSKGGQAGPNARCESRTDLTVVETRSGTITVENVRIAEDGSLSGRMILADLFELWEQTMTASGSCSPLDTTYDWHRLIDLINTEFDGALEQTPGDDDSLGAISTTIDLGKFAEPVATTGDEVTHRQYYWSPWELDIDDVTVLTTSAPAP